VTRTARWLLLVLPVALLVLAVVFLPTVHRAVDDATAALLSSIEFLGLLAVLAAITALLVWVLRADKGLTVLAFEIPPGVDLVGAGIADLLVAGLLRISAIHTSLTSRAIQRTAVWSALEPVALRTELINLPQIDPAHEELNEALVDLGNISVNGSEISVGRLLLAVKLLRRSPKAIVVRGSMQKEGGGLSLTARVETRRTARSYRAVAETVPTGGLAALADDLAYQVIADHLVSPTVSSRTWAGFKLFTEALDAYGRYTHSGDVSHLGRALDNCEAALRVERNYGMVFPVAYNVGVAHLSQGDVEGALRSFEAARTSDMKAAPPLIGLGMTYHRMGRYGQAIDALDQALVLVPQGSLAVRASALGALGNAHSDRGDMERAIDLFHQAVALSTQAGDPTGAAQNLSRLARRHADLGELSSAVAEAQEAVDRADRAADAFTRGVLLDNLAAVLVDSGDYVRAQTVSQRSLEAAAEAASAFLRGRANLTMARAMLLGGRADVAAAAAEAATAPEQTEFRHTALAFAGVAALRLGRADRAAVHFREAIQEADAKLDQDDRNFGAMYAKALALDGLARLRRRGRRAHHRQAAALRRRAGEINPSPGVLARQDRLASLVKPSPR